MCVQCVTSRCILNKADKKKKNNCYYFCIQFDVKCTNWLKSESVLETSEFHTIGASYLQNKSQYHTFLLHCCHQFLDIIHPNQSWTLSATPSVSLTLADLTSSAHKSRSFSSKAFQPSATFWRCVYCPSSGRLTSELCQSDASTFKQRLTSLSPAPHWSHPRYVGGSLLCHLA